MKLTQSSSPSSSNASNLTSLFPHPHISSHDRKQKRTYTHLFLSLLIMLLLTTFLTILTLSTHAAPSAWSNIIANGLDQVRFEAGSGSSGILEGVKGNNGNEQNWDEGDGFGRDVTKCPGEPA